VQFSRRGQKARSANSALLAALTLALAAPVGTASAQDFFQSLFGGFQRQQTANPPQASAYAPVREPSRAFERDREHRPSAPAAAYTGGGGGTAYCVRLCDGRYFPIRHHAGASQAELCHSFCPASKTMVFHGSKIDYARAPNGTRYADLDNAFAYRDRVTNDCTCNGRDGLGLARIDAADDPTLRQGDIVATNEGLATFRGRQAKTAEFTPIDPSAAASRRRLGDIRITPAPAQTEVPAVDNTPPSIKDRRAQLVR
jgi:hypothetical protein